MTQRKTAKKYAIVSICLGLSGCYGSSSADPSIAGDAAAASANASKANGKGKAGASGDPGGGPAQGQGAGGAAGPVLGCDDADAGVDGPVLLESHTVQLWPPNHKFHAISVDDCVTLVDPCDRDLHPEFIWASSDEPVDDIGDGHHSPDIQLSDDCQVLEVRSERQGPQDGRVYTLGVRVVDHDGGVTEAECKVIVAHDQSGAIGADSGEAYRIKFDGTGGMPSCDGVPPPPPVTPPTTPPAPPAPPGNDPPAIPDPQSPF